MRKYPRSLQGAVGVTMRFYPRSVHPRQRADVRNELDGGVYRQTSSTAARAIPVGLRAVGYLCPAFRAGSRAAMVSRVRSAVSAVMKP